MTRKGVKSKGYRAQRGLMSPKRKHNPGWTKQGFTGATILERDMKTKRPDLRGNPK